MSLPSSWHELRAITIKVMFELNTSFCLAEDVTEVFDEGGSGDASDEVIEETRSSKQVVSPEERERIMDELIEMARSVARKRARQKARQRKLEKMKMMLAMEVRFLEDISGKY